jgi:hypothetical protein
MTHISRRALFAATLLAAPAVHAQGFPSRCPPGA